MNRIHRLLLGLSCVAVLTANSHGDELPIDTSRFGNRSFGFYLGVSASHFTSASGTSWNSRYGPDLGSVLIINLTDLIALQPELAYVSKGAKWEEQTFPDGRVFLSAGDIRLGYIQFAVLARLNQPLSQYRDEHNFRPKLLAGFAFNTRVHTSARGIDPPDFQDTELSFIFGGGFDQLVAPGRSVTADVRFDVGLNKVNLDWKNNTVRFLLGMTL